MAEADGRLKECVDLLNASAQPVYRHWKGGLYEVLGIARDAGCDDSVVVYRRVGETAWYTRTARNFFGMASGDRLRFRLLKTYNVMQCEKGSAPEVGKQ